MSYATGGCTGSVRARPHPPRWAVLHVRTCTHSWRSTSHTRTMRVSPDTISVPRRCCHSITMPEPAPAPPGPHPLTQSCTNIAYAVLWVCIYVGGSALSYVWAPGPRPTAVADKNIAEGAPCGDLTDPLWIIHIVP